MPDFVPTSYVNYSDRDAVTALLLPGTHPLNDHESLSRDSGKSDSTQRSLEAALTALDPFAATILVAVHPLELAATEVRCRELALSAQVKCVPIGVGLPQQEILIRLLPAVTTRFVVVHEQTHSDVGPEDFERLLRAGHRLPAVAFYSMPEKPAPVRFTPDAGGSASPFWRALKVQAPYFFRSELLSRACRWSAHLGQAAESVVSMMRRAGCRVHLLESKPKVAVQR